MTYSSDESPSEASGAPAIDFEFCCEMPQDEFDRYFFERILHYGDSNTDVLRRLAELHSCAGDYESALKMDRLLAARFPGDAVVHYNLACSLSMTGSHRDAILALGCAIDLGYRDFAHIEADADLDAIRDLPDYQRLVARLD